MIGPSPKKQKKAARKALEREAARLAAHLAGGDTQRDGAAAASPATDAPSAEAPTEATVPADGAPTAEAAAPAGAAAPAEVAMPRTAFPPAGAGTSAAPRGEAPEPSGPRASTPRRDAPPAPVARPEPPVDEALQRLDALRDRVEELLALAEEAPGGLPPLVGFGRSARSAREEPVAVPPEPAIGATPPFEAAPDPRQESRATPASPPEVAEPPTAPAVLVARELLARGMAADSVRARLRDAYGVADPDGVLAALAG
jgi:hypothetical protein